MEELIQGVKSAADGSDWSNSVRARVAEACPTNIVVDFFILL